MSSWVILVWTLAMTLDTPKSNSYLPLKMLKKCRTLSSSMCCESNLFMFYWLYGSCFILQQRHSYNVLITGPPRRREDNNNLMSGSCAVGTCFQFCSARVECFKWSRHRCRTQQDQNVCPTEGYFAQGKHKIIILDEADRLALIYI